MSRSYPVQLTGGQLRVLTDQLALILNDPDWPETSATSPRDWAMLQRAAETLREAHRRACKAESTPA